ncbi:MAG: hypothetical protein R8K20_10715 [Gallionellaceae bacterium]
MFNVHDMHILHSMMLACQPNLKQTSNMAVRTRAPQEGPEADLVDAFLRTDWANFSEEPSLVLREPKMPTGYPDLVAVFVNDAELSCSNQRFCLDMKHMRVLHHVYSSSRSSLGIRLVANDLNMRVAHVNKITLELQNAGLVEYCDEIVSIPAGNTLYIAGEILAIEAKISSWRSALRQAIANTWFATQSYMLIPRLKVIDTVCLEASKFGVGVIVFDRGNVEVALEANKIAGPVSYGSWVVNEWASRHYCALRNSV